MLSIGRYSRWGGFARKLDDAGLNGQAFTPCPQVARRSAAGGLPTRRRLITCPTPLRSIIIRSWVNTWPSISAPRAAAPSAGGKLSHGQLAIDELHRFPNTPVRDGDSLCWDTDRLWLEVRHGLDVAVRERNLALDGIGVDTWGVDFGLLGADGQLVEKPPPLSRRAEQWNGGEGPRMRAA